MIDQALRAFGLDDLVETPHQNGFVHHLHCFGCQAEVGLNRWVPGTRVWCTDCRKAGRPAAQRQKDWRERRRMTQ